MALKLMGKKRGMTQIFDEKGHLIVCTVIEALPNVVAQIKTTDTDGYEAIQLGFDEVKAKDPRRLEKRTAKPQAGHFKKAAVAPCRHLKESKVEKISEYNVGQQIDVSVFSEIQFLDITGISKGKGYQGVMKLHNFRGGPASHGSSFHRHAGSTGMRTTPGRCLPGGKRASHMGLEQVTVQNVKLVKVIAEDHVILVKGQVPGPNGGLVYISPACKKQAKAKSNKK